MSTPADRQLTALFELLTPSAERIDRIEQRLLAALDQARPQDRILHSLAAEWVGLLRSRPVTHAALVLAAGFLLLFSSPIALVPLALLT